MLFSRLLPLILASPPFVNQAHATSINSGKPISPRHQRSAHRPLLPVHGIIFDNALNWAFVSATPASQAQILSEMPVITANAVGISRNQHRVPRPDPERRGQRT
ncbi:hypothetical protein DFH08DRAFT_971378 [Mycena albidolilacea]|uniref:Uncharacterized protein n=1 Tax=Mycena albidolilacea TaxID=1033008 RepID=A0AAD7EF01_9AGAR|nr:hypothetical protein DFH08DRAFT_971378 [Mycena albidolilacea]